MCPSTGVAPVGAESAFPQSLSLEDDKDTGDYQWTKGGREARDRKEGEGIRKRAGSALREDFPEEEGLVLSYSLDQKEGKILMTIPA